MCAHVHISCACNLHAQLVKPPVSAQTTSDFSQVALHKHHDESACRISRECRHEQRCFLLHLRISALLLCAQLPMQALKLSEVPPCCLYAAAVVQRDGCMHGSAVEWFIFAALRSTVEYMSSVKALLVDS